MTNEELAKQVEALLEQKRQEALARDATLRRQQEKREEIAERVASERLAEIGVTPTEVHELTAPVPEAPRLPDLSPTYSEIFDRFRREFPQVVSDPLLLDIASHLVNREIYDHEGKRIADRDNWDTYEKAGRKALSILRTIQEEDHRLLERDLEAQRHASILEMAKERGQDPGETVAVEDTPFGPRV